MPDIEDFLKEIPIDESDVSDSKANINIYNSDLGKDLSEKMLFSLVDILSAYGDQIDDYQKHGIPITDEDL